MCNKNTPKIVSLLTLKKSPLSENKKGLLHFLENPLESSLSVVALSTC